jgi:hypothetical protein
LHSFNPVVLCPLSQHIGPTGCIFRRHLERCVVVSTVDVGRSIIIDVVSIAIAADRACLIVVMNVVIIFDRIAFANGVVVVIVVVVVGTMAID